MGTAATSASSTATPPGSRTTVAAAAPVTTAGMNVNGASAVSSEDSQTSQALVINRRGKDNTRDQAIVLGFFTKVVDFGCATTPLHAPADFSHFLTRFRL